MPSFRGDEVKEDTRGNSYDGQDWTEVKIRGKSKTPMTQTVKHANPEVMHKNKLANSTDAIKLKKLTAESKQAIVAYRMSKKITQEQLNQECRFPVNTIREIEAGRLNPSIGQLNTLNRVLKTGLKLE
jgi:ribosome-binding protein aMBF1 (putative translation factor)